MDKATPRPWHLEGPFEKDGKRWGKDKAIVNDSGECVASEYCLEQWEANAELIVKAVNEYDKLKAKEALFDEMVVQLKALDNEFSYWKTNGANVDVIIKKLESLANTKLAFLRRAKATI